MSGRGDVADGGQDWNGEQVVGSLNHRDHWHLKQMPLERWQKTQQEYQEYVAMCFVFVEYYPDSHLSTQLWDYMGGQRAQTEW